MSTRTGRIGVKGAANMDVFNLSLLRILKSKEERLMMMERMSNANVDLGRYAEPEEEIPLVGNSGEKSNFAKKVDRIRAQRSIGETWVERFADRVDDMEIHDTRSASEIRALPKTEEERTRNMVARSILMSKVIRPPKIPRSPIECKPEDFQEYTKQTHSSVQMCCKCWRGAGPGPGRIDCGYCGAFAHIYCLEAEDKTKLKFVSDTRPPLEPTHLREGATENQASPWMCPFCRDSLDAENKYSRRKYEREMYKYRTVCAVIRMQAAIRSRITGAWFHRMMQAVKLVQRAVRSRLFWKAEEMKKKMVKRPVRIRLHDIDMFVKQAIAKEKDRQKAAGGLNGERPSQAYLPQESHKVGDMPSIQYEDHFGSGSTGESANLGAEMMPMMNLLRMEHQAAPSYCDPCSSTAKRPKGELMMTISVHQMYEDGLAGKQEYRIDIPLAADVPASRIITRRGKGGGSIQLQKLGAHSALETAEIKAIANDYRLRTYRVAQNRPYILIPFVTAETLLRITVSEVTDWPKTRVCGQMEVPIFHNLLWKRVVSYVHDFKNPVGWHDLPTRSDGSALTLMLPKEQAKPSGDRNSSLGHGKGNATTPLPTFPGGGAGSPRKSSEKSLDSGGGRRRGGGLPGLGSPAGATSTTTTTNTTPCTKDAANTDYTAAGNHAFAMGDASALAAALVAKTAEAEAKDREDAERRKKEEREAQVGGAKQAVTKASAAGNKGAWEVPVGGFVTWSLIPVTDTGDCQYGTVTSHSTASLSSSKKRMYLVLIDRVLLVYNPNMIKPRYSFPVTALGVSATEGVPKMITVKNPNETLFVVLDEDEEGRAWFKKLYTQSWAAPKKPYTQLKAFPGGHAFPADEENVTKAVSGQVSAGRRADLMASMRSLVNK